MTASVDSLLFLSWERTFLLTLLFFGLLYFISAGLASGLAKWLSHRQQGQSMHTTPVTNRQIRKEIRRSLVSIVVFALLAIPVQVAYAHQIIHINWSLQVYTLIPEILVLFFWNELHFYACHRLLHHPWLFRRVHYQHHQSTTPTPYATYSFHWFEAFLLGTVIYLPLSLFSFQYLALLSLPVLSILLNTLGHWDYDLAPEKSPDHWLKFSFRHSQHHRRVRGNYGFFLPYFDQLFRTKTP
ncbi:MAG: sterol desaturase family protein [Cyclobacteriaceae bacterium]|jgi:lathosterol oxidase|uniref:Sterol desaturase family protein n=1 Tax=Roseihalotalea indica TaxID=2867963 RepID=A0AA49GT93_9BACT|nr:sterol desaturase family protein [Tunicatimonas sp. TK19036]